MGIRAPLRHCPTTGDYQHKDRPSSIFIFKRCRQRPKGAGCSIQYISRSRIATIDYERLRIYRNFARSPDCSAFQKALYNQSSVVTNNQHPLFYNPEGPSVVLIFQSCPSCTIFKTLLHSKIRTPISCALSVSDPASSPAIT